MAAFQMPCFNQDKEFEKIRASQVVKNIDSNFSLPVCEWASIAFANISAIAMQSQNAESLADFLDSGACEALVAVMTRHAATSKIIASNGCAAILHLSWSSVDLREFLGDIGGCEVVVFAVSLYVGDPEVSEYGSGAIGVLAKLNIANSFKLAEAGACDVMSQVGNFGFNMQHPKCQIVATNVCFALALMSEASNTSRLRECGAGDLITQLLRLHMGSEGVVTHALKALCGLASLNFQMREELGMCSCCEVILQTIKKYESHVSLVQDGCETLMHLCLNPENAKKVGAGGGCEVIVSALRDRLMENDFGAEVCCGGLLNLMTNGDAADVKCRLLEASAVDEIKRARMSCKASYRARECAAKLLQLLGADPLRLRTSSSSDYLSQTSGDSGDLPPGDRSASIDSRDVTETGTNDSSTTTTSTSSTTTTAASSVISDTPNIDSPWSWSNVRSPSFSEPGFLSSMFKSFSKSTNPGPLSSPQSLPTTPSAPSAPSTTSAPPTPSAPLTPFATMRPKKRLLIVQVLEARDLAAVDKKSGTSDPFVTGILVKPGEKEVREEGFQTQHKTMTLNPQFLQTFEVGKCYSLKTSSAAGLKLKLVVQHHSGGFSSPVALGQAIIPLSALDSDGAETDDWFRLQKLEDPTQRAFGEIHLKVKFSGPPIDTFPLPDDDDGVSGGKGKASPSKTLANGYTYESFN